MTLGESWANAHGNYTGGAVCVDCSSGKECECVRKCKSDRKHKMADKVQTAYAIGFAVCLVLVLMLWSVWPMMMGAVDSFKAKFTKSPFAGSRAGYDAAGAGGSSPPDPATAAAQAAQAAQAAYQLSQQQQWAAKVASATSAQQQLLTPQQMVAQQAAIKSLSQYGNHHLSNGYIAGLQNNPGATNGSQLSMKYQTEFDHSGAAALSGTDTFKGHHGRSESGQNGIFSMLDSSSGASSHSSASGFEPHQSHASGFESQHAHASGFAPLKSSSFAPLKSSSFAPLKSSSFSSGAAKGSFVGGVASQYPPEWPGTSRDDDVTEMTLRGGVSDYVASLAAAAPTAQPAAQSGFANGYW